MFFLFIQCESRGGGYYLPQVENWSGRLELAQSLVRGSQKIELPYFIADGKYSLGTPEGFYWVDGATGARELVHCSKVSMRSMDMRLDIYVARVNKEGTALRKYALAGQPVTIGSREDNVITYSEIPVSRSHATIMRRPDGTCQFADHSRNGSFINGRLHVNMTVPLKFGDMIVILPALIIVYLGDCLAVSGVENAAVHQTLARLAPAAAQEQAAARPISVVREYHRSPRHIQQATHDKIAIEQPIEKERQKETPAWLAVGPSFTMVLPMLISGLVTGRSVGSSLAMIGTSSALAVMWAMINRKYHGNASAMNEERRQQICAQYYAEMEERLGAVAEREKKRLLYNYLSVEECLALPGALDSRMWEKMPTHSDFLTVRLGLGEKELPADIEISQTKMALTDDPLRHEPQRLYDQFSMIRDVPVLFKLMENQVVGVLSNKNSPWLMQSILAQAAASHSYHDVRIAVLHTPEDAEQWRFAKWLPHVFATDDRALRMVVSQESAVLEVLGYIDNMLSMRLDLRGEGDGGEEGGVALPWFLIFVTDPKLLEDQPIMRYLSRGNLGYTLIIQTPSVEMLPKECGAIIEAQDSLGAIYTMDGQMRGVRYEQTISDKLMRFAKDMASIRIKESVENSAIPSLVTFLETYGVRDVKDLDLQYFWGENHAYNAIKSRLGLKAGASLFTLDISDKNHGPHGLIAGTTGAGKSVLLQSFILSLSINYSPTEVQFILIDYKGGGTSEDFRDLPHVAGVIDSLQGERMIFRALASIKGEILRREEMFKNAGVNNIDDYMRYCNSDPAMEALGHLIIIVDEFAELKKEQPDFMHELVSAARVGRSLGMHLVLATQKPSNSVSDEIAANTRFRVCLRVASKSDSMEMLKHPDAAYIKGMGRCYVQVGNDEVFEQVQTSYSGAKYSPEALRPEEEPRMLDEAGRPIRVKAKSAAKSEDGKRAKTELDAVLEHIDDTCVRYHFDRARRMWLDELTDSLCLGDMADVSGCRFDGSAWPQTAETELMAYVALADDIKMQRYLPVAMDLMNDKNHIIVGQAGSGKTTMLQTLAVSLALRYSPEKVNIYIFSLTSRMLSCLEALPHVGDIVYEDELDDQIRLMEMIAAECERRKRLFDGMSTDNFVQYNRALRAQGREDECVPAIVVLIDRMQQLRDWANSRKDDKLQMFYDMLRSANSQGVYFVLTAFDKSEVQMKYQPYVHGMALQLNDRFSYGEALGARVPAEWGGIRSNAGRGLIAVENKEAKQTDIYEIQTAVYGTLESDASRAAMIAELGKRMSAAWTGKRPAGIERIPEEPTLDILLENEKMAVDLARYDRLPIGYNKGTGSAMSIDLRDLFGMLICGGRKSGKTTLLRSIALTFAKKDATVYIVGGADLVQWAREQGITAFEHGDEEWKKVFGGTLMAEVSARSKQLTQAKAQGGQKARNAMMSAFKPIAILIDDLDVYMDKYSTEPNTSIFLKFYLADNVSGYAMYTYATISHAGYQRTRGREPVTNFAAAKRGVMLQGRLGECNPFDVQMPFDKKNLSFPAGEGYIVSGEWVTHAVFPLDGKWGDEL